MRITNTAIGIEGHTFWRSFAEKLKKDEIINLIYVFNKCNIDDYNEMCEQIYCEWRFKKHEKHKSKRSQNKNI